MISFLIFLSLLTGSRFIPFFRVVVDQTDQDSLLAFQQEFHERSGMQVSIDYLSNARITIFYWGTRRVCGYVLNVAEWSPLRYLSFFTPTMQRNLLSDKGLHKSELIELTCLWKVKKLPSFFSAIFYASMLIDACRIGLRLNKRFLIGGSVLGAIRSVQRQLLSVDIFIGFLPHSNLSTQADQLIAIYTCQLSKIPLRATRLLVSRFVLRENPLLRLVRKLKRQAATHKVIQVANRTV